MKKLWLKLKSIFKKKEKDIIIKPFEPLKWGIIVPHTSKAKGAQGSGTNEYDYGLELANCLKNKFHFATRDKAGVKGAALELYKKGVRASLEPHLNAYDGKAKGYEILILKGDETSKRYASHFLKAFAAKYPNRVNRGIKEMEKGERGAGNLLAAKSAGMEVVLLSEMFFIDNPHEFIKPIYMADFWSNNLTS